MVYASTKGNLVCGEKAANRLRRRAAREKRARKDRECRVNRFEKGKGGA